MAVFTRTSFIDYFLSGKHDVFKKTNRIKMAHSYLSPIQEASIFFV